MSWLGWLVLVLAALGIATGLYCLHCVALWLEDRGLLYYLRKKPQGAGRNVAAALQEIYQPSVRHVVQINQKKLSDDESGRKSPALPTQFVEQTLPTLAENLALDEALLLEAEAGRGSEVLRLWEWQLPAIVLGAGCRLAEHVDEAVCLADGVPILRRSSGGGTVLLGPGCLCYSLLLSYDRSPALREVRPSFAYILEQVRAELSELAPGIELAGVSDLALSGRKFSGNSQQRKRNYLLHHGTILYDFNIERIGRYLPMPARQPEYRCGREHTEFLTNLPLRDAELRSCLRCGWSAHADAAKWPGVRVSELVLEKYANAAWIRRR